MRSLRGTVRSVPAEQGRAAAPLPQARISEQCTQTPAEGQCQRADFAVDLRRTTASFTPRRVTLRFTASRDDLLLYSERGTAPEVLCRGSCVTTVMAGEHFLRLGLDGRPTIVPSIELPAEAEHEMSRQTQVALLQETNVEGSYRESATLTTVGGVLSVVGLVGTYALLYGLAKEKPTATWAGAATAIGGIGLGLPLVFYGLPSGTLRVEPEASRR